MCGEKNMQLSCEFNKAETLMTAILTQTQKWSEQEKKHKKASTQKQSGLIK